MRTRVAQQTAAAPAKGLRTDIGTPPDGLAVHITGQAGVGADSSKAVEGVDGTLHDCHMSQQERQKSETRERILRSVVRLLKKRGIG